MKKYLTLLLLPVLLFSCKDEKKPNTFIVCSGGICDTIELIGMDTANFTIINDTSIGWNEEQSQVCDTIYIDTLANGRYFDKWGNKYDSNGVLIEKMKYE